ncbi:MAG: hypothetical protein PWP15_28 [Methanothermococcus sp.]|jgi:hypothetical protein|uniref:hypothetical protein n=1 Tax=Methanothermococcus TaxID=155862 RepID=UPI0004774300|nr:MULTISPECIES: hypothetical protein [Methanothermococcus]MDK2789521.1 hypothetical protein [Methanothermococcus sp.]MDK2987436.1 hypothetical protein [Methanothermococcus sp.]
MRYVAYKIHPEEFLENEVVGKTITIENKRIHRVRVLGEVKNVNISNITTFELDGILVKDFENKSTDINDGDFLDVIGRVGEYEGQKYIALEIYKKRNENREKWRELRNIEIEKTRKYLKDEETPSYEGAMDAEKSIENEVLEDLYGEFDTKDLILDIIRENDEISYEELLEKLKIDEDELDDLLSELKEDGEVYEPSPGNYRIL